MTFCAFIQEGFASSIGEDSDYPKGFCGFPQSLLKILSRYLWFFECLAT
jgi:hypothetical protein